MTKIACYWSKRLLCIKSINIPEQSREEFKNIVFTKCTNEMGFFTNVTQIMSMPFRVLLTHTCACTHTHTLKIKESNTFTWIKIRQDVSLIAFLGRKRMNSPPSLMLVVRDSFSPLLFPSPPPPLPRSPFLCLLITGREGEVGRFLPGRLMQPSLAPVSFRVPQKKRMIIKKKT